MMGYASYYENIVERASEPNYLVGPLRLERTRPIEAAPAKRNISPAILISRPVTTPRFVSPAERSRHLREVHILCLSELRRRSSQATHT